MKEAEKELLELLKRNNCSLGYSFDFPMYRKLPIEVQLALQVLKKNGLVVRIVLESPEKPA